MERLLPTGAHHQEVHQLLHPQALAEAEEVSLPPRLAARHQGLVAKASIPTHQGRTTLGRKLLPESPQVLRPMLGRMLLAGPHLDIENQAEVADHEGVVGMRRAPRLMGVVANLSALLVPVDRLDRGVHVEDPRPLKCWQPGVAQGFPLPMGTGLGIRICERSADTVLAADLGHAEALGVDGVGPQGSDMGVAELAGEDREGDGAQQVGDGGSVGASELQRAGTDPLGEKPRRGEELAEEDQLAQSRYRSVGIPLDMETSSLGVDHYRRRGGLRPHRATRFGFTPRVSPSNRRKTTHPPIRTIFSALRQAFQPPFAG